jgi:hypothetical protein
VLCLISLMDLTITHMVLVLERIALCLIALVTAHVLNLVIVSHLGLVFFVGASYTHFEARHLDGPCFPRRGSRPIWPNGEVERIVKTSSGRMVKCWIPKIYLTNPNTESSTHSHCHTQFLCQNQVLIVCMTQDQLFHTYGQKCSQITKCHK